MPDVRKSRESNEGPVKYCTDCIIYENLQKDVTLEVLKSKSDKNGYIPLSILRGIFGNVYNEEQMKEIRNKLEEDGIVVVKKNGMTYVQSQRC